MTQDTGVRKKRLFPVKGMDVGPANTDAMDADKRLSSGRMSRFRGFGQKELSRGFKNEGFHKFYLGKRRINQRVMDEGKFCEMAKPSQSVAI